MVVRDYVEKGIFEMFYIPSTENPADIGTKPLPKSVHWKHMETLMNLHKGQVSSDKAEI